MCQEFFSLVYPVQELSIHYEEVFLILPPPSGGQLFPASLPRRARSSSLGTGSGEARLTERSTNPGGRGHGVERARIASGV